MCPFLFTYALKFKNILHLHRFCNKLKFKHLYILKKTKGEPLGFTRPKMRDLPSEVF